MARETLAGKWMRENGHSWSGYRHEPAHHAKMARSRRANRSLKPVLYHELLEISFKEKRNAENRYGKGYGSSGVQFLKEVLARDAVDHCVLMPFCRPPDAALVTYQYSRIPAARAMCMMAHGRPEEQSLVARHLCGNGHFSCVNPRHLAWGTNEENARDMDLHNGKPISMPDLAEGEYLQIKNDRRLPNIIAIEMGIHAAVIEVIQRGRDS